MLVLSRRCVAEMGPATRYTLGRNTASMVNIDFLKFGHFCIICINRALEVAFASDHEFPAAFLSSLSNSLFSQPSKE